MIVILDSNESILDFMDDADASIEITDTYGGYKSLDFKCELTDVKNDEFLFKQGNKLFIDNVLFVMNTEVETDFVQNLITLEAEELVCELNNCEPFYVSDARYSRYVSGNTVSISKNFLSLLFNGFYTVSETDLPSLKDSEKIVTVNGTITKYNLLKEIEETTGLLFKYSYALEDNSIKKYVSLLKPENYGVTHSQLLERVIVGENTNKLEYSTDETKNALGIMPIIKSENTAQVDYTKILRQFNNLDINNENIMPYFENYSFSKQDILDAAETLHSKIELFKFIPETVSISHEEIYDKTEFEAENGTHNGNWPENRIYTVDIGMSQFLDFATQIVINSGTTDFPLKVIGLPTIASKGTLNCVFSVDEIFDLAVQVQDHISKTGEINSSISTSHGIVSFQWLVYIFAEYLTTNKKVVCTEDYPKLNKILPSTVEEEVRYIVDYENYESMPFLYTQNTSESNTIPTQAPANSTVDNILDVTNYISETLPVLKVK
ncbi:MAG: hypothetical protein IJ104_07515 [Methanobrevibacter sp.]|nr:hypothetical protein [Methanobrevibacter sp.]